RRPPRRPGPQRKLAPTRARPAKAAAQNGRLGARSHCRREISPYVPAVSLSARSRAALGLASMLAAGCRSDTPPPSPVASESATADGTAGGPNPSRPGGSGGLPAHCQALEDAEEDDETGMHFRFDVGAAVDAPSFPFDCAHAVTQASNLGCEFWAVDLPNDGRGTEMSPPAAEQQFAVVVANPSGLEDAIVEVHVATDDTLVAEVTVPPGEARTI